MMLWVKAPHFTAGLVCKNGIVVDAAPILKWAINKKSPFVTSYFRRKGYKVVYIYATS